VCVYVYVCVCVCGCADAQSECVCEKSPEQAVSDQFWVDFSIHPRSKLTQVSRLSSSRSVSLLTQLSSSTPQLSARKIIQSKVVQNSPERAVGTSFE
jgi:hypothetical protein